MQRFRQSPILVVALALMVVTAVALVALAVGAGTAVARVDEGGQTTMKSQVRESGVNERALVSMRMPPARVVQDWLVRDDSLALNASEEEVQAAVASWYKKFQKENYTGPDPIAYRKLLAREKALLSGNVQAAEDLLPTPQKNPLYVKVVFGGTDVISHTVPSDTEPGCVAVTDTFGPSAYGEVAPPGPLDNASFWIPDFEVHYQSVIFGEGPDAPGYGVYDHPVLGPVDMTGLTLQNFLLEMSGGTARMGGGILPEPTTAAHSHEFYGLQLYEEDEDGNCVEGESDARRGQFAADSAEALKAQYGATADWSQYDADGNHVVDVTVFLHAGADNASSNCVNCLWSHSSSFPAEGFQVAGDDTPADTSDDYYLKGYNVVPETLDLGVLVEEYEHQWGLPDIYTTDGYTDSAEWWCSPHTGGVYGGAMAGTKPAGHCLWQDYMLGWRTPRVVNYDDPALELELGRPRQQPAGTEDGLIIKLPTIEKEVENKAGEGVGWWSDMGDDLDNRVYRSFDLITATAPITFTFDSFWDIEPDYDYGYIEVSTDGGATWTTQKDLDGVFTDSDPNSQNQGWGLTGASDEAQPLRFDFSAFAGKTISLRFRYLTDTGLAMPAWWVDNLLLVDANGILYENDLETGFSGWTDEGWVTVPFDQTFEKYYLVEWRDNNGLFDSALNDPYQTVYSDDDEWIIDHLAFNNPGLLITLRDTEQQFDYELGSNLSAAPSVGPKHGLLTVESHYWPKRFDTKFPNVSGGFVGPSISGRVNPGDSTFGLTQTPEWTARLGVDYAAGEYVTPPLETKTWPSEPGTAAFHDALGYYPGYFYPGSGSRVYPNDSDASAVVPAKGNYSTRITQISGAPFTGLYGVSIGSTILGSGNPGDVNEQYGIHVEVEQQSSEKATVKFWNALWEVETSGKASVATAAVGDEVGFDFTARNVGGAANWFFMIPLPAGTTYVDGSAYGGLTPVADMAAATAAVQSGADVAALAAPAPEDVTGFVWLYYAPTGLSTTFGFKVTVGEGAAGTILSATATAYDLYNDDTYLEPYRTVTAGDVRVANTVTLPLMYDTWVNGGSQATNYNAYAALIDRTTGLDNVFLTFDRSLLPAGQEITAAELKVNVSGQSGQFGKSLVAANVNAFDPMTVTYANAPLIFNPGAAVAVPDANGSMAFDVASQVAAWGAAGDSLAISAAGPGGRVILDSLESYQGQPATLTLTYLPQ